MARRKLIKDDVDIAYIRHNTPADIAASYIQREGNPNPSVRKHPHSEGDAYSNESVQLTERSGPVDVEHPVKHYPSEADLPPDVRKEIYDQSAGKPITPETRVFRPRKQMK